MDERPTADFGADWRELCDKLTAIDKDFAPPDLSSYFDLALRVARFSFSVSDLSE